MQNRILRHSRRTSHRVITASVLFSMLILGAAGCQYAYPDACANHGGIRAEVKAVYYCNDGTSVGSGWLWLNHKTAAP